MKTFFLLLVCLSLTLAGCSGLPWATAEPVVPPEASATSQVRPPTPAPTAAATPNGPLVLRLWVPPQFDPAADTPSGRLLQARLEEFHSRRPDVQIEVRVKALDGPGGLYESLATTTAAAQLAMPDLVVLPHTLLQTAAVKGLLRPMNGLTNVLDDPDWYDYARQVAGLQNSIFGLPFAGDVLVQVTRAAESASPATNWETFLGGKSPLAFAAADPQALFTLAQYHASGGELQDAQGTTTLDVATLAKVLEFYKSAADVGLMPAWLAQLQSDAQAREAFNENRAGALATWLSQQRQDGFENATIGQIPTQDGKLFTLASGWAWTLTSADPEKRPVTVQLAEFLIDSPFLGRWSEAAGILPARPSALAAWDESAQKTNLEAIAESARLYPSVEALKILGPALQEAVVGVLKGQIEPLAAAQAAVKKVNEP